MRIQLLLLSKAFILNCLPTYAHLNLDHHRDLRKSHSSSLDNALPKSNTQRVYVGSYITGARDQDWANPIDSSWRAFGLEPIPGDSYVSPRERPIINAALGRGHRPDTVPGATKLVWYNPNEGIPDGAIPLVKPINSPYGDADIGLRLASWRAEESHPLNRATEDHARQYTNVYSPFEHSLHGSARYGLRNSNPNAVRYDAVGSSFRYPRYAGEIPKLASLSNVQNLMPNLIRDPSISGAFAENDASANSYMNALMLDSLQPDNPYANAIANQMLEGMRYSHYNSRPYQGTQGINDGNNLFPTNNNQTQNLFDRALDNALRASSSQRFTPGPQAPSANNPSGTTNPRGGTASGTSVEKLYTNFGSDLSKILVP